MRRKHETKRSHGEKVVRAIRLAKPRGFQLGITLNTRVPLWITDTAVLT